MPIKNRYAVLGVSRMEDSGGIRIAYHEAAEPLHPDLLGAFDTPALREIVEAYTVLSNEDLRKEYDRQLAGEAPASQAPAPAGPPSESIAPSPISLFGRPETTHPSFDEFQERYERNFTGWRVPKGEKSDGLTVDVLLSPFEAMTGCLIPVGVPVFEKCAECAGTGHVTPFGCVKCRGGMVESSRVLQVHIPPLTRAGTVLEIPLEAFGIGNLFLRIHLLISDESP